jgi:hypothetical protein
METGIFKEKSKQPSESELVKALGKNAVNWNDIKNYILKNSPSSLEMWNYSAAYGWSFRIKDKKRVIAYFMPYKGYFRFSMVYGEKAASEALESKISAGIKEIISSAKVYAEGRGFRIEVRNKKCVNDIKLLIDIKLKY